MTVLILRIEKKRFKQACIIVPTFVKAARYCRLVLSCALKFFLVNWSNYLREKSQKEVLKWQQWIIME